MAGGSADGGALSSLILFGACIARRTPGEILYLATSTLGQPSMALWPGPASPSGLSTVIRTHWLSDYYLNPVVRSLPTAK